MNQKLFRGRWVVDCVTARSVTVTHQKVSNTVCPTIISNAERHRSPLANHLCSSRRAALGLSDGQGCNLQENPKWRYYVWNELRIWISMKKRSLKQRRTASGEMMSTSNFKCSTADIMGSLVSPHQSRVGQLES